MIPLPSNVKLIAAGVALAVTFVAGWTVNGWRHDGALKKALEEKIELQQAYDAYAREVAAKFQNQQAEQAIVYRDLKRKITDVTDNRICFADGNALSVWNSALTGDVPKATTGTTKTTTSTDTFGATDTEILTNVIENFEQSKQIRDQLNALIDWYETNETIGK
jgi:protein-arginine kinase activator protein McsA